MPRNNSGAFSVALSEAALHNFLKLSVSKLEGSRMLVKTVHFVPPSLAVVLAAALFMPDAKLAATPASPPQVGAASTAKTAVYVSDFDLDVGPANADRNTSTATSPPTPQAAAKQAEEARRRPTGLSF